MAIRSRWALYAVALAGTTAGCQPPPLETSPPPASGAVRAPQQGALSVNAALRSAGQAGHIIAALDDGGRPHLLIATRTGTDADAAAATTADAARLHLARSAASLGIDAAALATAELVSAGPAGEHAAIARFRQRIDGIAVHGSEVRLLMTPDHQLSAVAGSLHDVHVRRPHGGFALPATEALASALFDLYGVAVSPALVLDGDPEPDFVRIHLTDDGPVGLPEPARARKEWFPDGDRLLAAWSVELYARRTGEAPRAFRYLVAADDGRVLERNDLTQDDSFDYRVWAEASGDKRPLDGPLEGITPHPTGMPDGFKPAPVPPNLVAMEGFNKGPNSQPDPWLPPGATETNGNNVNAYVDRSNPDGLSNGDFRAGISAPGAFDRVYRLDLSPTASTDQGMAAVTQLFYVINWLHDYFYDSGFDEAAGNAQKDNFARGGAGGDALKAEAQDNVLGGARDNANMSTPSDGMSPRMQVYVWNVGNETRRLTVTPPGTDLATGTADFGAQTFDVTAELALVTDGAAPATDACQVLVNGNDVKGRIALIDRGTCSFQQKVANAEAAGAVGTIIVDNQNNRQPPHLGAGAGPVPTIPAFGVLLADGNTVKMALLNGPVTAHLVRQQPPQADASLDTTIVAHEWGHYLHHRLTNCNQYQCSAMSEGWADFNALLLVAREGDDLDGAYPLATYAAQSQADSYYGLRRWPYSVDMNRNPLTFKHIANGTPLPNLPHRPTGGNNAEVHNAGEVWAEMMWDVFVALQKAGRDKQQPFETLRRTFADYLVAGLQLTPADATYLEQRDALLAAMAARSKEDLAIAAAAFARRGAGSCAKAPARDARTLSPVTESFDVKGRVDIQKVTLDDSVRTCDHDGVLDGDERGQLMVTIANGGPVPLSNVKVSLASATAGVGFPQGASTLIPAIEPLASQAVSVVVALDRSVTKVTSVDLDIKVEAANTCDGVTTTRASFRGNFDETPMASATDDVESESTVWKKDGMLADAIWSRAETGPLARAWRGVDWGAPSDTALVSPELHVKANEPFTVRFDHKYTFEEGDDNQGHHFFDGALVELSSDGGGSWIDVAAFGANPGYRGTITDVSGNPLAGLDGYVGVSPAWPNYDKVALDFGNQLAGKTVQLRFRIGTDQAAGAAGWEIDNIAFGGISDLPFSSLVEDRGQCKATITASAGPDRTVPSGQTVALDASDSASLIGRPLTYAWTQTAGSPQVQVAGASSSLASFVAPPVGATTVVTLQVTVSDGIDSASDTVDVTIVHVGGQGCCSVAGSRDGKLDPSGCIALVLMSLLLRPARRRLPLSA